MQSNEEKCHPSPPARRDQGPTDDHSQPLYEEDEDALLSDDEEEEEEEDEDDLFDNDTEEEESGSSFGAFATIIEVMFSLMILVGLCGGAIKVLAWKIASGIGGFELPIEQNNILLKLQNYIQKGLDIMPTIIIVLIALFVLIRNIKVVPQAKAYVIERLGKYKHTWSAGLHIKIPFIDRIANKVSLKEQVFDFEPQSVITKDNVTMKIDTVVYLKVFDPELATYGVEHVIPAIENLTATTLRNLVGELSLDETLTSRDVVNGKLQAMLDEATDPWGIKISRVELKNIMPPRDIQEAMEKQMRAEREKREAILRSEGSKESQILEATGRKEATILDAEAAKQKAILEAQADREAAITRAEGEAEAIKKVKDAEAAGLIAIKAAAADSTVLQLKALEALEGLSHGEATTLFVPSELASLAGTLATLKTAADKASGAKTPKSKE